MSESINANATGTTRLTLLTALALLLALLPGCKNAAAPPVQVTVQAQHPVQGPIAEQIAADAILAPIAAGRDCAQNHRPGQEILCPARRKGEGRRVARSRSKTPT